MNKPKKRDMFLGGNTSEGFFSFFDYLISQEDANRIICLKGGPGTGKSSLMKKISFYFLTKGYNIEQFHCSSDDQSLDGILIKELKVAMVDGTAPHVTDPKNPGLVDEIVNLAVALDEKPLLNHKSEIISLKKELSDSFNRAYTFFASSRNIYKDWINLNHTAIDENSVAKFTESLKNIIFPESKVSMLGKERHLFATAFTPNGIVSYTKNISEHLSTKYVLEGEPGLCKNDVLESIGKTAKNYGYFVEYFHNPLIPSKLEHIVIPQLDLGIFTKNEISKIDLDCHTFDMKTLCNHSKLKALSDEIEFNRVELDILLNKGLSLITKAKLIHDELEKFYVQNMDYNIINDIYNNLIRKIESYS